MKKLKTNCRILTIVSEEEVGAGSAPTIENERKGAFDQPINAAVEKTETTNNEGQTSVVIEATNREEVEQQLEKMGKDPTSLCVVRIPDGTKIISELSFESCWNVKKVIIPNSVLVIGEDALIFCDLEEIEIPSSVVKIEGNPFYGNNIRSITVDKNNPIYDSRDDSNAIIRTEDNTLIVGSGNTVIPESVVKLGRGAFSQDSIEHVNIPKSIIEIEASAIRNENIKSITVDKENPIYDSRNGCNAVIETETNTLIAGCMNTVIPDTVEKIGKNAFSECLLSDVVIPDSVKVIEDFAFSNCEILSTVIIGKTIQTIDDYAFEFCDRLDTIILLGNEPKGNWKKSLPIGCKLMQV